MWDIEDNVVGEIITLKSYEKAYEEAERRINMHSQEYPVRHRAMHYAVQCELVEDKLNHIIYINRKE